MLTALNVGGNRTEKEITNRPQKHVLQQAKTTKCARA